jgi:2-oxoglutarate dehydrogenase complex dehydrogenase (E1) component-like enzyme
LAHFESEFEQSLNFTPSVKNMTNPKYKGSRAFTHKWRGMVLSQDGTDPEDTGYALDDLRVIAEESVRLPADFTCHPRLQRFHIDNRVKGLAKDSIDWATAEAMALGSLNLQGFNTRVVGEDSERGTFSQRHAVFHDQNEYGRTYTPLQENIVRGPNSGRFQVLNTNLNEVGTMGYEYGYSLESPKNLCMWEA